MMSARSNIVVSAAVLVLCLAGVSFADTITLQPDGDAGKDVSVLNYFGLLSYAINSTSGVVYGVDPGLYYGVSFIEFSLPAFVAPIDVTSARLGLYAYDVTVTADHRVHEVTEPWTEPPFSPTGEVTAEWPALPAVKPDPEDTVTATAGQPGWLLWDVTSLVSGWTSGPVANNGVVIATEGGSLLFHTSEYETDPALRPYLQFDYVTVPEPTTLALTTIGFLGLIRRRGHRLKR